MSPREASCPGCGATLTFRSGATLLVVCPYCDSASWRGDVNLELLGKVAAVADVDTVLALGATGRRRDLGWVAVGLVQLDHGAGPWNEWALALDDGSTAWLAEAQGELLLSRELPAPAGPLREELEPGLSTSFADRSWVVAEVGQGRVTTARGELPADLRPGATYAYADLRGPGGAFATLTYGESGPPVLCFVGQTVDVASLGIDRSTVPEREPRRVAARRISCGACGQSIDLRHPDEAKRVGCPSCGSLLDATAPDARVVDEHKRRLKAPALPLGARVKLRGLSVEVLAMLVRSVRVDGVRYPWAEYLLRVEGGGYRWLVEAQGHWSLVEPLNLGDVNRKSGDLHLGGRHFRHFQSGEATVDVVMGEVYWEVRVGEKVRTIDWVAPPEMVTLESSDTERVASLGRYLAREEVQAAFGPKVALPAPAGVAPHQPNRWREVRGGWWRTTALAALALLALWIGFGVSHQRREVLRVSGSWTEPPAPAAAPPGPAQPVVPAGPGATPPDPAGAPAAPAAPEPNVVFTEPFELTASRANLHLELDVPVLNNAWLGLEGALVAEDSGEVRYFALAAEQWSGVTDGEAWSEGDRRGAVVLGQVPAGRYALRLECDFEGSSPYVSAGPGFPRRPSRPAVPWTLRVRSQVPSAGRPWLVLLLLLLPALVVSIASWTFEKRRWQESDHAE